MGALSHPTGQNSPGGRFPLCINCKYKLSDETENDAVIQYLALRKMGGSDISNIFASFTRHITAICSYRYYMFDTQKLRMYILINKHIYQMRVISTTNYWIFGVNINSSRTFKI